VLVCLLHSSDTESLIGLYMLLYPSQFELTSLYALGTYMLRKNGNDGKFNLDCTWYNSGLLLFMR
jgi:hypothetical protein